MRFAQLADGPTLVALDGESVRRVDLDGIETLDALVAAGSDAWERAAESLGSELGGFEEQRLAPPLLSPGKIVAIGLNYRDHATEQEVELPEVPLVFAKFPSALTGPRDQIRLPLDLTEEVDYEAELAVVIGHRLSEVDAGEALAGVFGYTAANDVSARDLQFRDGQWVRGKSIDTFCPLGPLVVAADEFGAPDHQRVETRVNGRTLQSSDLGELIFGVGELLAFLSRHFTLEPGDLVLTGTPAGVGAFRQPPIFLHPGDLVEVEIEGIGLLRNPVVRR